MGYPRWNELSYAGETHPPTNPETPLAGSWPLYHFRFNEKGELTDLSGNHIQLKIKKPKNIDWEHQLGIVQDTLKQLTDEQKKIAAYWGTGAVQKQISPIAERLIDTYGLDANHATRVISTLHSGINDALCLCWGFKYKWYVARPDQLDSALVTFLCTPRHPSYPSGHATSAGYMEVILSYFFPGEAKRLRQLAEECAHSRLYAGVHYKVDNDEGLQLGRQIGNIIVNQLKEQRDEEGNLIDVPYKKSKHADLMPPPYEQINPYDYPKKCTSLVIDEL